MKIGDKFIVIHKTPYFNIGDIVEVIRCKRVFPGQNSIGALEVKVNNKVFDKHRDYAYFFKSDIDCTLISIKNISFYERQLDDEIAIKLHLKNIIQGLK